MFVFVVICTGATAHAPLSGAQNVVQAVDCAHAVPPVLHVSTFAPLQRVAPGVHAPVQSPLEQPLAHVAL